MNKDKDENLELDDNKERKISTLKIIISS